MEETARLTTRQAESGRVRVQIRSEAEQQQLHASLRSEAVTVERLAVGRQLAPGEAPPQPHEEEDGAVYVIPILEEVLVVEKRLVVREELRLRRTSTAQEVETPVTVMRQHASVERLPPEPAGHDPASPATTATATNATGNTP
jgi:stress response protein YsnF